MPTERNNRQLSEISDSKCEEVAKKLARRLHCRVDTEHFLVTILNENGDDLDSFKCDTTTAILWKELIRIESCLGHAEEPMVLRQWRNSPETPDDLHQITSAEMDELCRYSDALLELQRETQRETLMEAARLECPFCAGADGTIDTIPHFYSGKQYISNYGEVENEYIHASNWGGHFGCNAQKIMAEIARRCELERKAKERI